MEKRNSLVIGGSNGIGLAISTILSKKDNLIILDRQEPNQTFGQNVTFIKFDLMNNDYTIFENLSNSIDTLIITAGIGKLSLFKDLNQDDIIKTMTINSLAPIRIINFFKDRLYSSNNFDCAVMDSIAGFMSSPLFSVYGASKAALKIFIESVNVELIKYGTKNRILNVSPGSLKGTKFNNGENDLKLTIPIAGEIIKRMYLKEDLWIPQYEEIFKHVLERYNKDFRAEGIHSYEYKINSGRMELKN